ncbi:putative secreted lipase [Psilocybe cubensis]|uniref:Secreted lipase n=2 Tax=Psilocybe cubensis TaxID=181762 RepID=A0ACB8H2S3_PSICU|nr:putative secreted lipase [Psilocybe cubensis]KAH9481796.1 putative secreted lipase [Psilocybe cubensis]
MKYATTLAGILALALQSYSLAVGAPPIIDLGYAQYQGTVVQDKVTNATHTQFLGIRYAAPPTGAARFQAPALPATTPGVQQANAQPPECFQANSGVASTTPFRIGKNAARAADAGPSEDCLFLNVFLPGNLGEKKKLPVVFWIHGGGYIEGSASGFDGNDLIRASGENVIAVVIQYRLGVFGFLPGQKVKDGGALNAGLLDQQFALQWVQKHIRKFGGDPKKVTIWGESAGAGSVLQHVVANGGKTRPALFRAAMTSSTFLPSQYKFNDRIPEASIRFKKCSDCASAADALECLRQVDVNTLQNANAAINLSGFFGTFVFVPVIDGTFSTDRPTVLLKEGKVNGQIILSVTNTFEGVAFVNQATANTVQVADYASQLFPNFTPQQAQAVAAQYAGLGTNIFQVNAIMGESIFICPTYFLLRAFGGAGFKASIQTPSLKAMGEFAIPPGSHGEDVGFYFNNGGLPSAFRNQQFVTAFSESFQNFVISLNTNTKTDSSNITPSWPLWNGSNEMLFNKTAAGAVDIREIQTSTALLSRCEYVIILFNLSCVQLINHRFLVSGRLHSEDIAMFANSSNLVITGGTYTQVANLPGQEFFTLHSHIASGALHDSGERFNPPRCHPETRRALLSEIVDWVRQTNRETVIMWLYGSIGSGKSALAQSLAEKYQDLGLLAATFFFARLSAERCHERRLSPTISYQLAISVPETRSHIEHVIHGDPSVFDRAFQTQYQKLVVNPLSLIETAQVRPKLVIIDGLDECLDPKAQRYILDVISQEFHRRPYLPLLYFITSRVEDHIRTGFTSGLLQRISKQVSLQDYLGSHDDIRIFIQKQFEQIKRDHPLRFLIPSTWPAEDTVETLVRKSSGQFAYAATVVQYVSSIHHRPPHRLDAILGLSDHVRDPPFAGLDSLYGHVFSLIPYQDGARRILSVVILVDLKMPPSLVEQFLSLEAGDVQLHMSGLSSIIDFREHHMPMKMLNDSFGDFLLDPTRSGDMYIDSGKAHADLATACLLHLEKLEVPILIDYACYNLERHLDLAAGTVQLHEAICRFRLSEFMTRSKALCTQQGVLMTLEDIWYFIPSFLDCVQNSIIFDDAIDIYNYHLKIFDEYLESEFDKYIGDGRLQDMVTMLTICHSPVTVPDLESVPYFKDSILDLNESLDHLIQIDESALNIRHMVRRHGQSEPYIEILCQYLEDEGRSGRHFIDGDKYARAALRFSKRISGLLKNPRDDQDARFLIWSLECTPPLLLHANHHEELETCLKGALIDITAPPLHFSFYPTLVRMPHASQPRCGHSAHLSLVPQGLRIQCQSESQDKMVRTDREQDELDAYLINPITALYNKEICCCSNLLTKYYFRHQLSNRNVHHEAVRSRGKASVIVHVEDPFPEIISSIGQNAGGAEVSGGGVIKIITYRIWRSLVGSQQDFFDLTQPLESR